MIEAGERRRGGRGSGLEALLRSVARALAGGAADRFRESLLQAFRRVFRAAATGAVGTAMLIAAAVFLLIGGVEGLKAASLPSWAAYLVLGLTALAAGAFLLDRAGSRSDS